MRFPRAFVELPERTPNHVVGPCVAMIATKNGPRRKEGPVVKGKPAIEFDGEIWKAPRLSFSLNVMRLPRTPKTLKRGLVCHHCDNAWCIEPNHLYFGTASQNTKDIWRRNEKFRKLRSFSMRGNQNAKGYKFTKQQRKKLSARLIGNKYKLGKKESAETRLRKSIAAKNRKR